MLGIASLPVLKMDFFSSRRSRSMKEKNLFSRRLQMETLEQRAMLDITSGLLAHWAFDETSGTTASDSSGNGNAGTLASYANWEPTAGVSGGAIRFSENNDGVLVESATGYNLSNMTARTISVWFKADDINDVGIHPIYEEGNSNSGMVIYLHAGYSSTAVVSPTLVVGAWDYYSTSWSTFLSTTSIASETWYHVVVTLDGSSGVTTTGLKAYLNGTQFGTGKGGPLYYGSNTTGYMADDTGIGRNYYGIRTSSGYDATTRYYFHGLVDDVRVYNRTLTATEVTSLYSLYSGNTSNTYDYTDDLAAYYQFNETSGTSVSDSAGSHTGTLTGTTSWATTSGVLGGALSLTNGSMTLAAASDIDSTTLTQRTVVVWFNCTSYSGTTQIIYEQGSSTHGLNIYLNGGYLYVGGWNITGGTDNWTGTYLKTDSFSQSEWHQVALVLNGSSMLTEGALLAYLDGQLMGSGAGSQITADTNGTAFGKVNGTTLLDTGATTGSAFTGMLDEARIYNRALTGGEIAAMYDDYKPSTSVYVTDNCPYGTVGTVFPNSLTSDHFVIYWGNTTPSGWTGPTINTAWATIQLHWLEEAWNRLFDPKRGSRLPNWNSATKYKVNVYVTGTGMGDDTGNWATGGADSYGNASFWVQPAAMLEYSTTVIHELTHAVVQLESGGFQNTIYGGWFWENHANYSANTVITLSYGVWDTDNRPNLRLGSTDCHYLNYYFLVYLAERYGYDVVNSAWYTTAAASSNADPMTIMASILKTVDSSKSFADIYGEFARHQATWLWYDAADIYRSAIGSYMTDTNRTVLKAVEDEQGWYTVDSGDAPAQYSYNVVQISVDGDSSTSRTVTVNFQGYQNAALGTDYRVTLVAADANGNERYSSTWSDGELTFTLNAGEKYLYLVVAATPTYELCTWGQDYTTQQRYPYKISVAGGIPAGQEVTVNGIAGHYHANGGGFVASTATVASTAYVAATACVLGTATVSGYARILDYAVVQGSAAISSYAVVRGHAVVQGSAKVSSYAQVAGYATVQGSATVTGYALVNDTALVEDSATISEYASILGGAQVHDSCTVSGHAVIEQEAYLGNSGIYNGSVLVTGTSLLWYSSSTTLSTGVYLAQQESSPGTTDAQTIDYNYLYGVYAFDTENSWRAIDSFGSNDGYMNSNTPGWCSSTGGYGGVLTFDGTGQYVSLPASTGSRYALTVATNVRWDGGANQTIMEYGHDKDNYWYLRVSDSTGTLTFGIVVGGVSYTLAASSALTVGTWANVAFSIGSGTAVIYVNGTAVATSSSMSVRPDQVMADYGYLGKGKAAGSGFYGAIDQVRFYSTVLTAAQVATVYQTMYGTAQYCVGQSSGTTTLTDTSGKNNGTITGSTTWATDSVMGSVLSLSQSGQYVTVPNTLVNTTDLTFSTWVKWSSTGAQTLFSTGGTSNSATVMIKFSLNSSGYLVLYGIDPESQFTETVNSVYEHSQMLTSSVAITTARWAHVAFTIQGHTAKIYVNGVVAATLYNWDFSPKMLAASATYIGRPFDSTTTTYQYYGYLYDTRICNFAMSDTDVATVATPNASLLGSWALNDGTDSSGHSNTLTFTGSPTFTSGHNGNALTLTGSQYGSTSSTVLTTTKAFSVSAWIKWNGTASTNVILSQDGSTSSVFSLQVTSAGYVAFYGGTTSATYSTAITSGTWYHVAGVYTGNQLKLFLNGTQVAVTTYSAMAASTGNLIVGAGKASSARANYFYGQIDDAKVYQGMLSNSAVYALYAGGVLPSGWYDAEIGSATKTAGASCSGTTWTVTGAGTSIGASTKDVFNYAYQLLTGDGTISARVDGQTLTATAAQAAIMFRNGTSYDAAFVSVSVTPSSGVKLLYRDKNGGTLYSTVVLGVTAPVWVKLVRSCNYFSGYYSTDGTTWAQIGSAVQVNMNETSAVGFAATSGASSTLNTATFSNVSVAADTKPTISVAAAASSSTVTGTTVNLSVLGADDKGESNLKYTWSLIDYPAADVTFSTNGTNSAKNTTVTFSTYGTYVFQVLATDENGNKASSSVTVTVVQTAGALAITNGNYTALTGEAVTFAVSVVDQFGNALSIGSNFTWSVLGSAGGTITKYGVYTASAAGTDTVTVTDGSVSTSATVTVVQATAYWTLNSTTADSSGKGNTLTLVNSPTYNSGGYSGYALNLTTASSQYAKTAGTIVDVSKAFSVSAWVYWTGTSANYYTILSQDGSTASSFFLQKRASGSFAFVGEGTTEAIAAWSTTPTTSTWYHLVGVYTGSALQLYVNGVLVATTAFSSMNASTGSFIVGAGKYSGNRVDYFSGRIDEVKVFGTALSAAQIAGVYSNGSVLPTPWVDTDIGSLTAPSTAKYASSTYTVKTVGYDITGTSDTANYMWQSLPANCSISVNVNSLVYTNDLAKAGLMIRQSLAADSAMAGVFCTADGEIAFIARSTTGGTASVSYILSVSTYLKLTRVNNVITAYYSEDGTIWTQVGSSVNLGGGTLTVGLTTCSRSTLTCTATFNELSFTKSSSILDRQIFYNDSVFDGNSTSAGAADDAAIAADKDVLQAGATATVANYSNYSKGINGVMIDIAGLGSTSLSASDFAFNVSADGSTWTTAPTPTGVTVRTGAGPDGSYRVEIIWADGAIVNTWLKVTMLSNANTGLSAADTFYFGNVVGDGDGSGAVTSADEIASRTHKTFFSFTDATNDYDYNKDGLVNATDDILARLNVGASLVGITVSSAPAEEESTISPSPSLLEMTVSSSLAAASSWEESDEVEEFLSEAPTEAVALETTFSTGPTIVPAENDLRFESLTLLSTVSEVVDSTATATESPLATEASAVAMKSAPTRVVRTAALDRLASSGNLALETSKTAMVSERIDLNPIADSAATATTVLSGKAMLAQSKSNDAHSSLFAHHDLSDVLSVLLFESNVKKTAKKDFASVDFS